MNSLFNKLSININNKVLSILGLLLLILYEFSDNIFLGISAMIIIFILAINPKNLIPLLFVLLVTRIYKLPFGITAEKFSSLLFVFFVLISILFRNIKIDIKSLSILFLLVISIIITTFLSFSKNFDFLFSTLPFFFLPFLYSHLEKINYKDTLNITFILFSIFLLFNITMFVENFNGIFINRYSISDDKNPNSYAQTMGVIYISMFSASLLSNTKKQKIIFSILGIISFVFLFLTGSRTVLFTIILITILWILIIKQNASKKVLTVLILLFVCILLFPHIQGVFGNRYNIESLIDSSGSGRFEIWKIAINKIIPNNLLFGVGFTQEDLSFYLKQYGNDSLYIHNFILSILTYGGIVFFIGIVYILFKWFQYMVKYRKNIEVTFFIILILYYLFLGVGEDVILNKDLWNTLGFGLLISKNIRLDYYKMNNNNIYLEKYSIQS